MTFGLDCSIKSICTIAKPKIDMYIFEFTLYYRNIKFIGANMGNLLGATAAPASLSNILSSIDFKL